jgi:hypothetical protein
MSGTEQRIAQVGLNGCLRAGRRALRDARLFLENSTVCQVVDAKMVHRRVVLVPFGVGVAWWWVLVD